MMCTAVADGVTGECYTEDNGMSHNIRTYQPAIERYANGSERQAKCLAAPYLYNQRG